MQYLSDSYGHGRVAATCALLALLATLHPASASPREIPNPSPSGITVAGRIMPASRAGAVELTQAALEKLPQYSFTTHAPWTRQAHTYSGVLLRDVLVHLGATGSMLQATALNDYAVDIPLEDARKHDVLLAYRIDGKPIPVRERGPMLVMYPFDQKPELQAKRYYERSIWQLKSITVR